MLRLIKSKTSNNDTLHKELIKELHQNVFDEKKIAKLLKNQTININAVDEKGKTLLFDLVKKRKLESVRFLIKQGLQVNAEDHYGKTILNEAINVDDGIMIRFLLENGASINHINKSKRTIMQDLALEGNVKAFKLLMIRQPNLHHKDLYQRNVLFDAIEGGNLEIVKEVIHEFSEEDLNSVDVDGRTALFYAVLKEDPTIAKMLINYGSDVNIVDVREQNVLFNAVILGAQNSEVVELLIKKGINLEHEDKAGFTILDEFLKLLEICKNPVDDINSKYRFVNVERNYLRLMSVLIENGLKINQPDKMGKTVLYKEIFKKNYEVIDFLITAGMEVDIVDNEGRTILFDVIFDGLNALDMIEYLVKKGANIDHRDNEQRSIVDDLVELILIQQNGKSPRNKRFLDIKQQENYFELLRRVLLTYKPKVNRPKNNGQTIAFELIHFNNNELLKLFISNDIDINFADEDMQTPLSVLIEHGMTLSNTKQREDFFERLTFLLKYKVNINAIDKNGRTILHKAVIADDVEVVEKLISSKKMDISLKDTQGRTALHHTQWKGNVRIAKLLIANGANINEPDSAGYTLLNYAAILGHLKLVELLISYGVLMYNQNKKSQSVTQFFLKNEANLDKLLQGDFSDEKMKRVVTDVVNNLKKEIRLV
ncbi:MAG: ankyrin repeat domain-containing protein [Arcobacteraceae bacterium]